MYCCNLLFSLIYIIKKYIPEHTDKSKPKDYLIMKGFYYYERAIL